MIPSNGCYSEGRAIHEKETRVGRIRSFCTTRDGLLRCVRELCGVVGEEVLDELQALPDFHPDGGSVPMTPAKLRRSRDVPEHERTKIKKRFALKDLAMLNMAFVTKLEEEELVPKVPDLTQWRSLVFEPARPQHHAYISSGEQSLRSGGTSVTVLPFPIPTRPPKRTRRPRQATKRIKLKQARCLMEGLSFAREIGTPMNTHLIIHWGGTVAGDDSDGVLFAKLRYLLDKRFRRKFGIVLTAIWVRERHRNKRTRQQSEVVHSHLLFHLPPRYRLEARRTSRNL